MLVRRKRPYIHGALAEIALAEDRPCEAIVEFRRADALPDGPIDDNPLRVLANVARAFDRAGESDSAIVYFERYLETPYFFRIGGRVSRNPEIFDTHDAPDAAFLARVYFRLGELWEGKRDGARATRNYAKFIELWQDADPELQPPVAEARRRIARLKAAARRDQPRRRRQHSRGCAQR